MLGDHSGTTTTIKNIYIKKALYTGSNVLLKNVLLVNFEAAVLILSNLRAQIPLLSYLPISVTTFNPFLTKSSIIDYNVKIFPNLLSVTLTLSNQRKKKFSKTVSLLLAVNFHRTCGKAKYIFYHYHVRA